MNNVRQIRNLRGMTQLQLAETVGVRQPHISRIENGDEGPPVELYRSIAKALDVPLSDLFSDDRTRDELLLLDVFRSLPKERQAGWIEMARLILEDPEAPTPQSDETADHPSAGSGQ